MNHATKRTDGFTLIELALAMTFISFLLIAIAMTVIQISNIYNRGITLKEVNQAGQSLSTELQRAISSSAPFSIEGTGSRYIKQGNWGGRLCLGQYSYIWNYGEALNETGSFLNVYSSNPNTKISFIKVPDGNAVYCSDPSKPIDSANAVELLNVGDHNLAIHSFSVTSEATAVDNKTLERLYSLTFIVGTNDTAALVLGDTPNDPNDSVACKVPGVEGSDLAYCSVQEFNIVARAGNVVE